MAHSSKLSQTVSGARVETEVCAGQSVGTKWEPCCWSAHRVMALAARVWQICGPVQRSRADIWADYSYSQKRCRKMALAHYPASRSRDWDCACLPEVPLSQLQGFLQCIQPLWEAPATVNSEDAHTRRQAGLQNNTSWQTAHGKQHALVPFPEGTHHNLGLDLGDSTPKLERIPCPQQGYGSHRAKRSPVEHPARLLLPQLPVKGTHFDRNTLLSKEQGAAHHEERCGKHP